MKKVLLSLLLAIACMPMAIGQNKAGNLVITDTTVCGKFQWINGTVYTHDTVAIYTQDSTTYILNLSMLPSNYDTATAHPVSGICSATWNNKVFKTPGNYFDTLTATNGCDSIIKIAVTLGGTEAFNKTITECGSYTAPWGQVYTASVNLTNDTIHATYCDYSVNLNLTINANVIMPLEQVEAGCSYTWNNTVITDNDIHTDTLTSAQGCDSIISLQVTAFSGEKHDTIDVVACDKYIFNGDTLTTSGIQVETDTTEGCINYTHINLTIINSFTDTANVVVRDTTGGCRINWFGTNYSFADTNRTLLHYTKTTVGNCDSLVALRITSFSGIQHDTTYVENCGKYTWSVNRTAYYTDTIAHVVDSSSATCVENKYLNLHIVDEYKTHTASACEKYIFRFDNRAGEVGSKDTASFIASGVYTTDRNGLELYSTHFSTRCVTHHTLNLTIAEVRNGVNPNPRYDTVCDKYTISFNGSRYEFTESTDSLLVSKIHEDVNLCYDTSMMVHIVVNHKSYADSHDTVCDSYYWPFTQQTYTASTVQTYVLPGTRNSVGCDSVGRLYLTVNHTPVVSIEGNWHLHPSTGSVAHLTIVDNPADNNTYKWFKNNETTPFSTEKTISETVSENTDIHLETTSDKGCTANNWITITYTVGIDEADDINVNLYPNPASRYLNVESSEGISEVIVYNAIGQQVIRRDVNATATQLDLGALAVGNYTLQIRSLNGEQTSRKFIVNK